MHSGSQMISALLKGMRDDMQSIIEANTTTGITYIGYSTMGTSQSATGWIIKRLYEVTVSDTTTTQITWATPSGINPIISRDSFNLIWSNRASYSYTIPA